MKNDVTLYDIYEKLGAVDAKQDLVIGAVRDHGVRIRKLEHKQAKTAGWAAGVALAVTVVWTVVGDAIKRAVFGG